MKRIKRQKIFRKTRANIAKDVLKCLAIVGTIYIAASSPYFIRNILKQFTKLEKYPKQRLNDVFSRFKRKGLIRIKEKNNQIYISLTEEGKRKAGRLQIDNLEIKRPDLWDGKWRLIVFDIAQLKKLHREAFRGKLKQLGFYQLQKSVWLYPFDCREEVDILRKFFSLSSQEMRLIIAENIGSDLEIRKVFGV